MLFVDWHVEYLKVSADAVVCTCLLHNIVNRLVPQRYIYPGAHRTKFHTALLSCISLTQQRQAGVCKLLLSKLALRNRE